jgi:L-threonylcarbamoyladenylate synthase
MRSANDECLPVIQRGASWVTGIKYVVGLFVGIRSVRICWFDIFNQLSIPLVLEPNKINPISRERFLIPVTQEAPRWITGKHSSLALRMSTMPIIKALNELLGYPIVSTSANRHGKQPLQTKEQVQKEFSGLLDYIVEGDCGGFIKPSTIIDIVTGTEIRP